MQDGLYSVLVVLIPVFLSDREFVLAIPRRKGIQTHKRPSPWQRTRDQRDDSNARTLALEQLAPDHHDKPVSEQYVVSLLFLFPNLA